MKKYLVGGAVRDKLMGKTPKDFDYTVVLERWDKIPIVEASPFELMVEGLKKEGFKIFLESPEHFTVRAQFPSNELKSRNRLTADFVLAREEGPYSDGRRPDWVRPGTLEDDLARRDFTMNAMAEDEDGNLIDPFNGQWSLETHQIIAVGNARQRMLEDALRALRAIRFSVVLGYSLSTDVVSALNSNDVQSALKHNISAERKMDELNKMFKFDSKSAIHQLNKFYGIMDATFYGGVNLMATMKQKGFNNG